MAMIFTDARVFCPDSLKSDRFLSTLVVSGDRVEYVGCEGDEPFRQAQKSGTTVDLGDRVVLPGFIDGHVHILNFSLSLQKLDLLLPTHPVPGWIQSVTQGQALATTLDDLDIRSIYIEALDLHSTWCNTTALQELQLESLPEPSGGTIHRLNGKPSGLLDEAAQFNIWPFLDQVASMEKKLAAIDAAVAAHRCAGYTGLVDMAMDERNWEALNLYRSQYGELRFHMAAHWLIPYSEDHREICNHIDRAIELHREFIRSTSPDFCINGIKLICDGTVDGCTAGLHQPYGGFGDVVEPIWPAMQLASAIRRATNAGLQCAIHAIGDRTVQQAIDCLSQVPNLRDGRHRIEHLELTTPEDAKRLGDLGIVASVQPVHLDPATFGAWPELIGSYRCQRVFAYREFADSGAPLVFGTDAPTARHCPLPNLYNATTRHSALGPSLTETVNPKFAVPLATAISAATAGLPLPALLTPGLGACDQASKRTLCTNIASAVISHAQPLGL
ncbi:Amidohydrolase 3 [Penicillium alfredii]|uniref:Amidohydrolase 3 n=1 Tax=Penicillium alfredii TaxID=1506179 RepID=A0A9W9FQ47_9EURO|nr:Amidohydrolase 3 [Penicillium alfredii]KAJ5104292.1 Amidohydrolase 3 [Penicillium alfredii]